LEELEERNKLSGNSGSLQHSAAFGFAISSFISSDIPITGRQKKYNSCQGKDLFHTIPG
jgi:hypothetical protein